MYSIMSIIDRESTRLGREGASVGLKEAVYMMSKFDLEMREGRRWG